jgi:hypothetical protein
MAQVQVMTGQLQAPDQTAVFPILAQTLTYTVRPSVGGLVILYERAVPTFLTFRISPRPARTRW